MDAVDNIVQALHAAHHAWKARGVHIRCLVNLLLEVDSGRLLDEVSRGHSEFMPCELFSVRTTTTSPVARRRPKGDISNGISSYSVHKVLTRMILHVDGEGSSDVSSSTAPVTCGADT